MRRPTASEPANPTAPPPSTSTRWRCEHRDRRPLRHCVHTAEFTAPSRIFHWLTAILIFAALFIGFTMVNWLAGYAVLRAIHMSIGAFILVVVVLRIINRTRHHPPAWPPTVGRVEGRLVIWTEPAMYGLLLAQPLVGWAMVSASGTPVRVFGGLRLPPIAPFNTGVFAVLREAHSILAY